MLTLSQLKVETTNSHELLFGTAGMADMILVNSKFTASMFTNTFKHLHAREIQPAVLYPAVNMDQFDVPHSYK
jgi:alpha-1,3/alpha-1,6-mannosyltransferase